MRGKTQIESGLRWASLTFGRTVKDEGAIFIVPNDLRMGSDTQWLMEKGVLTKQELLGMVELIDQEMKRKREVGM